MQEFNCLINIPKGGDTMKLKQNGEVVSCTLINRINNIENGGLKDLRSKYCNKITERGVDMKYLVGTITVSDRAYKGEYSEDLGTKALSEYFTNTDKYVLGKQYIVADEEDMLLEKLKLLVDDKHSLILTTGGTGLTKRDITSKVIKSFIDKEATGISTYVITESTKLTKFACLSNPVIGIKDSSLIISLPGSPKAIKENLTILEPILPHALNQIAEKKDFH
jgi:molybdopterin adenylyltransferase